MAETAGKSKLNPKAQPFVPTSLPPAPSPAEDAGDGAPDGGAAFPPPARPVRSSWDTDPFPSAPPAYGFPVAGPIPPHQHLLRAPEPLARPYPGPQYPPQATLAALHQPQGPQHRPVPPQHRPVQFQPVGQPRPLDAPLPGFPPQARPMGGLPAQHLQQFHLQPSGAPPTGDRREEYRPFPGMPPFPLDGARPPQPLPASMQALPGRPMAGPGAVPVAFARPLPLPPQGMGPTLLQPVPGQLYQPTGPPPQARPLPHMVGQPLAGMPPLPPQRPGDLQPSPFGAPRLATQLGRPGPPIGGLPPQTSPAAFPEPWGSATAPQPFPTAPAGPLGLQPSLQSRVPLFRPDGYPSSGATPPMATLVPAPSPAAPTRAGPPTVPFLPSTGFERAPLDSRLGRALPGEEQVDYMAARLSWTESVRETEDWTRQLTQGTPLGGRPTLEAQLATVAALESDAADADALGQFVVLLIGPPAAGKTTQANAICARYNFDFIDLGLDAEQWPVAALEEKVQLVWQTQRPGLVIENVPSLECASAIDDLCSRNGLSVGCVLMLEIDDMLKLAARARCRDKARGRREVVPTTELFGPIRDFMVAEQALLDHYRTFPALYRMDVNKPQSQVTGEILRILDTLHGHRAGTSALPRVVDETPLFRPEDCLDFIPDGPSQAISFLRSSTETRRVFAKLQEMLGLEVLPRMYPGRQPSLFDEDAVRRVCLGELGTYVVSKKFDGLQGLLLCLPNECYLVDHAMALYQLRPQLHPKPTTELLLDGELMTTGTMGWFTISDTLYANGQSLLAKPLPQRMAYAREHFAKEAAMFSLPALGSSVHLVVKTMAPLRELRRMMGEVETAKHGLYECLTLTPVQRTYRCGLDPAVFKWKSLPTCDFRLVYNDLAPELHLCSGAGDEVREVLFYHIDTDFSNQQKIKRMVAKIVECLPLSTEGAGDAPSVELAHQEWEIVRVRPSRTVPDHMDMVTATLRSHLTGDRLLELVEQYGKQRTGRRRAGVEPNLRLEDEPVPGPVDTSEAEAESVGEPEEVSSEEERVKGRSPDGPPAARAFKPLSYAEAVSGRPSGPAADAAASPPAPEPRDGYTATEADVGGAHEKGKGKGRRRPRGGKGRHRSEADWDEAPPPPAAEEAWPPSRAERGKGKGERGPKGGKGKGKGKGKGERRRASEEADWDEAPPPPPTAEEAWPPSRAERGKGKGERGPKGGKGKGKGKGKGERRRGSEEADWDVPRPSPAEEEWPAERAERGKGDRGKGERGEGKGPGKGKGKAERARAPRARRSRWSPKDTEAPSSSGAAAAE